MTIISPQGELTHYHTLPHFYALKIYSCGKIVRKGEIACNKQFLLFSQCFLAYMALIFYFKFILKCRLQFVSIWTSLKFCRPVMGYAVHPRASSSMHYQLSEHAHPFSSHRSHKYIWLAKCEKGHLDICTVSFQIRNNTFCFM